ncbi:MAG: UDP-N-acetylmuramoyl-L-alanine--D-glutamate ligase, partial [Microgenomates group bacterium]
FPDTQEKLKQQLLKAGAPDESIHFAQNMQEAVTLCYQYSTPGDICLLSPGFASYNQYANFPARGDDFARLVQELASQ